jgi:hypothetical protein
VNQNPGQETHENSYQQKPCIDLVTLPTPSSMWVHAAQRDDPDASLEVDLVPACAARLLRAHRRQDRERQAKLGDRVAGDQLPVQGSAPRRRPAPRDGRPASARADAAAIRRRRKVRHLTRAGARRRACPSAETQPHTPVMAGSPIRKLRKTGAVDTDGNVNHPAPTVCHGRT